MGCYNCSRSLCLQSCLRHAIEAFDGDITSGSVFFQCHYCHAKDDDNDGEKYEVSLFKFILLY